MESIKCKLFFNLLNKVLNIIKSDKNLSFRLNKISVYLSDQCYCMHLILVAYIY